MSININKNRIFSNYTTGQIRSGAGISFKNNNIPLRKNSFCLNISKIDFCKPGLLKRAGLFLEKNCKKFLENDANPFVLEIVNFGSKIILSPLMILGIAPFTRNWKEDKDSIKASALMHPVQAGLTLSFATLSSIVANKSISHYARKGTLGKSIDTDFAYFFNTIKNPHGLENLNRLKSSVTFFLTLAMIPLASKALDAVLPKILSDKKYIQSPDKTLDSIYARKLYPEFGKNNKHEVKTRKIYA